MIKSPKEKFQSSQVRTGQWAIIASDPIFEEACDAALLQMQATLPFNSMNHQSAFECHHQMEGAQRIVRILKTIHETHQEPAKKTFQGLNYNEGV